MKQGSGAEVSEDFLWGVGDLLGESLRCIGSANDSVWFLQGESGRRFVLKGVPRQEAGRWKAGGPWTELVVVDLLAAAEAPVPRLMAADLHHGWMVMEHVPGPTLREVIACRDAKASLETFRSLVRGVCRVEEILASEHSELTSLLVDEGEKERAGMLAEVREILTPTAGRAWDDLAREVLDSGGRGNDLGSLDLQPGNAIASPVGVVLVDFSSVGPLDRERRLVAYAHSAGPVTGTLIDERAYAEYLKVAGTTAALRLAVYDFAYLAKAANRVAPDVLLRWWQMSRLDDPRIERVGKGLLGTLMEAKE